MTRPNKQLNEELLLKQLKDIILREDREALSYIQEILNDKELLSKKVSPIIDEKLNFLRSNFPKEYEEAVAKQMEVRLDKYKDEVIGYLYPIMGKLIRKFVTHQFQMMKEKIDDSLRSTFSMDSVKRKIRSIFSGVEESDLMLASLDNLTIEEIYLIQRDTGLLRGKASRELVIDQDVIAGMLTAIKAFVEDAFKKENQDLEMIQYGSYKIFIQNFHVYYIAIAIQGSMSAIEQDTLSSSIQTFAAKELLDINSINSEAEIEAISSKLHSYFIK